MGNIGKSIPYVSGKMLQEGINGYLFSDIKEIYLLICNKDGNVLASSDIINGQTSDTSTVLSSEIDLDGNLKITIKDIGAERTKSFVTTELGDKAALFALSGWSAKTQIASDIDGITRYYPDVVKGTVDNLCIVGNLSNNPLITKDNSFQFNGTEISFKI